MSLDVSCPRWWQRRSQELWESGEVPEQYLEQVTVVVDRWRPDEPEDLPDGELRELIERQRVLPQVVDYLCKMTWRILISNNENACLTSDSPFHYFEGLGLKPMLISFRKCSTFSHSFAPCESLRPAGHRRCSSPQTHRSVMEINRRTASGADWFLFVHRYDRWVERLARVPRPRLNRIRWPSRRSAGLAVSGRS